MGRRSCVRPIQFLMVHRHRGRITEECMPGNEDGQPGQIKYEVTVETELGSATGKNVLPPHE